MVLSLWCKRVVKRIRCWWLNFWGIFSCGFRNYSRFKLERAELSFWYRDSSWIKFLVKGSRQRIDPNVLLKDRGGFNLKKKSNNTFHISIQFRYLTSL